jgi:hypothetical protein
MTPPRRHWLTDDAVLHCVICGPLISAVGEQRKKV